MDFTQHKSDCDQHEKSNSISNTNKHKRRMKQEQLQTQDDLSKSESKRSIKSNDHKPFGSTSLLSLKTSLESQGEIQGQSTVERYLRKKHWQPLQLIAEGGFSLVYKVKSMMNVNDNKAYVAKVMRLDQNNRAWVKKCLKNEMYISKLLKHPNIVRTYQYFKTNSHAVIIMQYASNGSIKSELDRMRKPYSQQEATRLFLGLMTGLNYIHAMNIAHRDLKLDNFFLDEERRPLIGDFGFATIGMRQVSMVLEKVIRDTRCGSEGYMAPEIANITARSTAALANNQLNYYDAKQADIYSMGVCFYEMLTKIFPPKDYNDTTNSSKPLKYPPEILDTNLKQLISDMLNQSPKKRPKTTEILEQIHNSGRWKSFIINKVKF